LLRIDGAGDTKAQVNAGKLRELYWFRDKEGLEVDFVVPQPSGRVALVEMRASRTVTPADARSLERLAAAAGASASGAYVVHPATRTEAGSTLAPGVSALPLEELLRRIG